MITKQEAVSLGVASSALKRLAVADYNGPYTSSRYTVETVARQLHRSVEQVVAQLEQLRTPQGEVELVTKHEARHLGVSQTAVAVMLALDHTGPYDSARYSIDTVAKKLNISTELLRQRLLALRAKYPGGVPAPRTYRPRGFDQWSDDAQIEWLKNNT